MGFTWQATVGGELPLGKIILVAYMALKGYNFEVAVLTSNFFIFLDIYTCFHILKYENSMDTTSQGPVEKSLRKYMIYKNIFFAIGWEKYLRWSLGGDGIWSSDTG